MAEGAEAEGLAAEAEAGGELERVRRILLRTPIRVFLVCPAIVITARAITPPARLRPVRWAFAPLLAWGYLQHRLVGAYRTTGPGGAGKGNRRVPDRLVTDGPYAIVRNPMYLGHLLFLAGLALVFRSRLGAVIFAGTAAWYQQRAQEDESKLAARFGDEYEAYRRRVPRWIPRLPEDGPR